MKSRPHVFPDHMQTTHYTDNKEVLSGCNILSYNLRVPVDRSGAILVSEHLMGAQGNTLPLLSSLLHTIVKGA